MKYKVLILKNRVKVPIDDDFQKATEYISKYHDFDIQFDFKEIDIPVETTLWMTTPDRFWFGTKDTKDKIRKYIPENKYHCVIFAWDKTESPIASLDQSKFALTSWSTWGEAIKGTEYIELVTSPLDDKINHIYHSIIHELYHSFVKRANRRGANILDVMDSVEINGVKVAYYKNDQPEAIDGNFAIQRGILAPHTDKILYMKEVSRGFENAVEVILENEGGYIHDKRDPGGETNMGISKKSYPNLDIKNITREQAIAIYRKDFWNKIKGDSLPYPIALQLFDMAVNCGVSQAVKMLQKVVGTKQDGVIGFVTIGALKPSHSFDYFIARLVFYQSIQGYKDFGKGWINRATKVYKLIQ